MASQEHLDFLKQGVAIWNSWRRENPHLRPNLVEADLSGMDLSEMNLSGANLSMVNLRGTNLSRADLSNTNFSTPTEVRNHINAKYLDQVDFWTQNFISIDNIPFSEFPQPHLLGANLREANFRGANFSQIDLSNISFNGANLDETDFRGANLERANLSEVTLRRAKLRRARLKRANLRGAALGGTDFSDATLHGVDLSSAQLDETDFSRADLRGVHFGKTRLRGANLKGVNLSETDLSWKNFSGMDLSGAILRGAILRGTAFRNAVLKEADLSKLDLSGKNFRGVDLSGAILNGANLTKTDFSYANLTNCSVYGIAAWGVKLKGAKQDNLVITSPGEPTITVDNLKIAQFIYLLLNNAEIREVIDTITSKVVLILGRFTPDRKAILDALREALRTTHGYVPILFDFDRPSSRNVTETMKTLAHLSRFIIADLTDPSSIPYELARVVPGLAVPVQPVLLEGNRAFAMFPDLPRTYHWVLPTYYYIDQAHLLATLQEHVIAPAEQKARELEKR